MFNLGIYEVLQPSLLLSCVFEFHALLPVYN